jgi:chloride channel 3/4/5
MPQIKTILSGFVILHFLDFKVLLVKAVGATFPVSTGMCLGKEGPFVHISTCVAYLVAIRLPK